MTRLSQAQKDEIADLREKGWSYPRIARKFAISVSTVGWHCLKMGAEPPRPARICEDVKGPAVTRRGNHVVRRFSPSEDAELLRMEREGMRLSGIARALDRKHNTISARLMTLARREARREMGLVD